MYLVTLLAALPLAVSLRGALQNHLGASLMAGEAADAVNYDWWQEFASQSTGLGLDVHAVDHRVRNDARQRQRAARQARAHHADRMGARRLRGGVDLLSGGILDRYARGRRIGAHGFFAASGTFFFRFLRLGIAAGIVYWFLFVYVHEWLFTKWYVNVTRDLSVERTAFYWRLLMYAIFAGLLALTTTIFDYAKVRAVVEDRRSMTWALVAALAFSRQESAARRGAVRGKRRDIAGRRCRLGTDCAGNRRGGTLDVGVPSSRHSVTCWHGSS